MDTLKGLTFIESSFLQDLLKDENITDISYNGSGIYYLHNLLGRKKSSILITENEAKDFIRQIANLSEKQFSLQNPKLDVSIGRYRINAIHPYIGRRNYDSCLNFSIRIASSKPLITDQSTFLNAELISLFEVLIKSQTSLVIGGLTGCGKTEFQRYLISKMEDYTRLIIIDNVLELDSLTLPNDLDINIWQADEKNKEINIQELVKNALRSNPDWLIVAESRGKEMVEVLNSAMTGHPIITTIHALNIESMPTRMARMVMMNEQNSDFQTLMQDIYYNFRFYIFLRRKIQKNGKVLRYIEEIAEIDEKGIKHLIYSFNGKEQVFYKFRKEIIPYLDYQDNSLFIKTFVKEK